MTKYSAAIFPAALLAFALLPLPYGYYTFLRVLVTGWAIALAYFEWQKEERIAAWVVAFAVAAALFNPLWPVHLPRETWAVLDLIAAGLFGVYAVNGMRQGSV